MRFWIDTEFNGFKGELISMALAAEDGSLWYRVLRYDPTGIEPWVGEHVIPVLNSLPISLQQFQRGLERYLSQFESVHLIADWPEDIQHFCEALITGPGTRINTPPLTIEIRRDLDAAVSAIPHNARADALANKAYMLALEGK